MSGSFQTSDALSGRSISRADLARKHEVTCAAVSPNGKHIASGRDDGTVHLWNVLSGEPAGIVLRGHSGRVNVVAFSSDGTRLVTCSEDKSVCLWVYSRRGTTISKAEKVEGEHPVQSVSLCPSSGRIATGSSSGRICVWSADLSAMERVDGHQGGVTAVSFGSNTNRIFSASEDHSVCTWSCGMLQPQNIMTVECDEPIRRAIISPSGQYVATVGEKSAKIQIHNAATGEPLGPPLVCPDWAAEIAFSPDGRSLVAGCGNGAVCLWDLYK